MMMKRITILFLAVLLLQAVQNASAVPAGNKDLLDSLSGVTFTMDGGTALADCQVFQFTSGANSGRYLYTYQITNNSIVGLSFFSIAVTSGAVINDTGWDPGTANPLFWTPVTDGETSMVQSVDALFNLPIKNAQTSALLWLVSDNTFSSEQGSLFGTSATGPQYAAADLFAPVPEPATISLLTIGGIFAARARRKNNG
jgi:hypothetical protein